MSSQMPEEIMKKKEKDKKELDSLVRIHSTDIRGNKNLYSGLSRIKGVSFGMVNAICYVLGLDKSRKVSTLSKEEMEKISQEIKNPRVPSFFKNRRRDLDEGGDKHLSTTELELRKEFDIKRLKKIRSYKGIRHGRGLPVRGQRTRSHFRKKGRNKAVGVKKKK